MDLKKTILTVTAWAFMLMACGSDSPDPTPDVKPEPEPEGKDVRILVTTNTRSSDLKWIGAAFSEKPNMSPTTITLNPEVKYQQIDGFGTAVTGSSCYNLLKMKADDRKAFLTKTFSPTDGMGHSYIRISIGCSDFSLSEYTCCDAPGLENFALQTEEKEYILPILKEILAINPDIKIMGSPWTCPRWMKVNNLTDLQPYNSWTSGHLNPKHYADYGAYFVKWIQAMKAEGINIYSVTPQNEPLNRGNSASLFMGWKEELAFIKNGLGPKLQEAGLTTKIYAFDHNYNYDNLADEQGYPIKMYEDPEAAAYLAGAAYHNYGGNREELNRVHNQRPDKELVFTETSIGTWNDGRNLATRLMEDMREVALGTVNNWCRGAIVWNLMLDSERGPNRDGGCQTCYGAVDIDKSNYQTLTLNSHYYIISHMAAVVKPGATRIGTKGYTDSGIMYAAFKNTDGTYAFVLLNETNESKKITLSDGTRHFAYDVPAKAVVSFRF